MNSAAAAPVDSVLHCHAPTPMNSSVVPEPETRTASSEPGAAVDPQNPWLGLASYTEETRSFFHGRDEEAAELARRVQRKTLTILFGQSGHGKTSLLRAGLVPRLRREGHCPVYVRIDYTPDSPAPAEQIKAAIFAATLVAGTWTRTGISRPGESLWEFLHHRDDLLQDAAGRPLVPLLIFDQFEEIFTLAQNDDAGRRRAQAFLAELADLVENRPPAELEARIERDETDAAQFDFARADYRVLISLREDYLAHLESLKAGMPSVTQNRVRLARFTGAQALAAVMAPAAHLVSEDVATQIVRFVAGGADLARAEVEPSLLSLVCRELNHGRLARGQREITADLLAGSRDTILSEFYERALQGQPAGVRRFIEDELLTDSGYRESVAEERVRKALLAAGAAPDALDLLVGRRLLRVEERLDVRRVELTHDVLCGVVKASRDVRQERERREAVQRQLAETRAKEAEAQRALWRARMIAAACGVVALAAIGGAVFGWVNQRRAERAEKLAQAAAERAGESAEQAVAARRLADATRTQAEDLLGYVLTDLEEQLTAFGLLPIQLEITRLAVEYYTGLPPELMTVKSRAAYAQALSNLGGILDVQGEDQSSHNHLERARGLFEEIDRSGQRTPAMALDHALVLVRLARLAGSQGRFNDAVLLCGEAEKLLQPAVADAGLRVRALRVLALALDRKGFSLMRGARVSEAVPAYQRAIACAEEADTLPGPGRRPGLQAASTMVWCAEALYRDGRLEDATRMSQLSRVRLREFVTAEPALVSARRQLATATNAAALLARQAWDFDGARSLREETREMYREMLKLDPKNTTYLNNLGISYTGDPADDVRERDFAAALASVQQATAILDVPWASNFMRANLAHAQVRAGGLYIDLGRDAEAREAVQRLRAAVQPAINDEPPDSNQRAILEEYWRTMERWVDFARCDWPKVKAGAEQSLRRISTLPGAGDPEGQLQRVRENAAEQLVLVAWASGDYAAARQALSTWWATRQPLPANPPIARRFAEVEHQLLRIHVLARSGELATARSLLDAIWPEVEATLAAGSGFAGVQIEHARALWIKAEIAPTLTTAERRTLLEQARDRLRPLAAAGKLNRFERETLLRGIEQALTRASGT